MMSDNREQSVTLRMLDAIANDNENNNNKPKEKPLKTERVHCVISETTTTSITKNNNENSNWNAGGSVNAGSGIIGGSVSGGCNNSSSTGSTTTTTSTTTTNRDFWANKSICENRQEGSCNSIRSVPLNRKESILKVFKLLSGCFLLIFNPIKFN
jgi:hypothetical protein